MAIFGLLFLVACLIVIGIGIVIGLIAAVALAVLIGLGIMSSSAAVGFGRKSLFAGFLTLSLEVGAALGIFRGRCGRVRRRAVDQPDRALLGRDRRGHWWWRRRGRGRWMALSLLRHPHLAVASRSR